MKLSIFWGILKELFVFPFAYILSLVFFWPLSKTKKGACPIVLIHGYLNSRSVWVYHKKKLEKKGFGPIYIFNLGLPWKSIDFFARRLQKELQKIALETQKNHIVVIGHSMGGLVASYYEKNLAKDVHISHLITLGTPFLGTKMARFGFGACAKEMLYQSSFTKDIVRYLHSNCPFKLFSFSSQIDHIVIPAKSACVVQCQKSYPAIGHGSMLFSLEVHQDVCELLQKIIESGSSCHE